MSIDKSLKPHSALKRHRSVLTRAERVERLETSESGWTAEDGVLGLPKVRNLRMKRAKMRPEKATEAEAAAAEPKPADGA